ALPRIDALRARRLEQVQVPYRSQIFLARPASWLGLPCRLRLQDLAVALFRLGGFRLVAWSQRLFHRRRGVFRAPTPCLGLLAFAFRLRVEFAPGRRSRVLRLTLEPLQRMPGERR